MWAEAAKDAGGLRGYEKAKSFLKSKKSKKSGPVLVRSSGAGSERGNSAKTTRKQEQKEETFGKHSLKSEQQTETTDVLLLL